MLILTRERKYLQVVSHSNYLTQKRVFYYDKNYSLILLTIIASRITVCKENTDDFTRFRTTKLLYNS